MGEGRGGEGREGEGRYEVEYDVREMNNQIHVLYLIIQINEMGH